METSRALFFLRARKYGHALANVPPGKLETPLISLRRPSSARGWYKPLVMFWLLLSSSVHDKVYFLCTVACCWHCFMFAFSVFLSVFISGSPFDLFWPNGWLDRGMAGYLQGEEKNGSGVFSIGSNSMIFIKTPWPPLVPWDGGTLFQSILFLDLALSPFIHSVVRRASNFGRLEQQTNFNPLKPVFGPRIATNQRSYPRVRLACKFCECVASARIFFWFADAIRRGFWV